jgi:hydrogenase 3 maturation protease
MDSQFKDQLSEFVHGRTCVLGIGNRLWRDDGVGSHFAEALQPCPGLDVIDAGFIPENHLESVVNTRPDCILMIDATDFGGSPGDARLLYPEKIAGTCLSTHAGSLQMLAKYLHARTEAAIAVLGIQPADTRAGEKLSKSVRNTLDQLVALLPGLIQVSDLP